MIEFIIKLEDLNRGWPANPRNGLFNLDSAGHCGQKSLQDNRRSCTNWIFVFVGCSSRWERGWGGQMLKPIGEVEFKLKFLFDVLIDVLIDVWGHLSRPHLWGRWVLYKNKPTLMSGSCPKIDRPGKDNDKRKIMTQSPRMKWCMVFQNIYRIRKFWRHTFVEKFSKLADQHIFQFRVLSLGNSRLIVFHKMFVSLQSEKWVVCESKEVTAFRLSPRSLRGNWAMLV